MKKFTFPLASVRDWRRMQLEVEEAKLEPLLAERSGILAAGEVLEEGAVRARLECPAAVADRFALADYERYVAAEHRRLKASLEACGARILAQQGAILAARRHLRLIEILEKRAFTAWQSAADRETEALAQELFTARWSLTRRGSS